MTFETLGLNAYLLQALAKEGYTTPTPIQQKAIPHILNRKDVMGCAQTGTGKTAAFALPMIQLLHRPDAERSHKRFIKALILTPTRELAAQIGESFDTYGKFTDLKNAVIFGGVGQNSQVNALRSGVDILIATPGRLLDLMSQGFVSFRDLEIFVLDEADRMLDMGFVHDVKKVITKLPPRRQSLFFSATMAPEIMVLASTILVEPEKVEVTPVASTAETIQQSVYFVDKQDKKLLLVDLLEKKNNPSVLIFTRTKHGANNLVKDLQKADIRAEAIHGNKSQMARVKALSNFKSGELRVLIATDIASRGIDIDELSLVINYELPNIPETYVHRIGRTGRAGASGMSISFCEVEERAYLRDIQKLIQMVIPMEENNPFPSQNSTPIPLNAPPMPKPPMPQRGQRPQRFQEQGSRNNQGGGRNQQGQKPSSKPAFSPQKDDRRSEKPVSNNDGASRFSRNETKSDTPNRFNNTDGKAKRPWYK